MPAARFFSPLSATLPLLLAACSTSPVTGGKDFVLMS